jgi:hypothetical protein
VRITCLQACDPTLYDPPTTCRDGVGVRGSYPGDQELMAMADKKPETETGEQHPYPSDSRLIPGGARGAAVDPGMSSLDRDTLPGRGESPRQQDIGSTRNDKS